MPTSRSYSSASEKDNDKETEREEKLVENVERFLEDESPNNHQALKNEIIALNEKEKEVLREIEEEQKENENLVSKLRALEAQLSSPDGITLWLRFHQRCMRDFLRKLTVEQKDQLKHEQDKEVKEVKYTKAVLFILCRLHSVFLPSSHSLTEFVQAVQRDNEELLGGLLEEFKVMGHVV
ncbi:uncharacterized protein LOC129601815 [Paramacrobiotus metropolitanus]|uniref:uncharacterized protein LOC129601815 n=1 Tax=Paramacrobiotus metropolitanus TaxID=2943436 RepID=UPI0024458CDC|nr:uncharacterized protein LOC129601815 [Paramacrobiotus metropolitanus]